MKKRDYNFIKNTIKTELELAATEYLKEIDATPRKLDAEQIKANKDFINTKLNDWLSMFTEDEILNDETLNDSKITTFWLELNDIIRDSYFIEINFNKELSTEDKAEYYTYLYIDLANAVYSCVAGFYHAKKQHNNARRFAA